MTETNFNDYFKHYIKQVDSIEPILAMEQTHDEFMTLLSSINEARGNYRYADGKWTIKEVLVHINDAERVFAYRAMRFARNDKTNLTGYDENSFANFSQADNRTIADLENEFNLLRQSSIALFRSFDDEMNARTGTANGIEIDVKSLAYLIAGHCRHHGKILKERYLPNN
jgi:DinB family protein